MGFFIGRCLLSDGFIALIICCEIAPLNTDSFDLDSDGVVIADCDSLSRLVINVGLLID